MKTRKKKRRVQLELLNERLFALELRVARRADALVEATQSIPRRSLECWLTAEREVLADVSSLRSFRVFRTRG